MTMVKVEMAVDCIPGHLLEPVTTDQTDDSIINDINGVSDVKNLSAYYTTLTSPIVINSRSYDAATHIGLRPTQEDRMLLVPELRCPLMSLGAVFDGTVGHHASHFAAAHFASHLCNAPTLQALLGMDRQQHAEVCAETAAAQLAAGLREAFSSLDHALLSRCSAEGLHYASSTAVV
eukprot:gene39918-48606_t